MFALRLRACSACVISRASHGKDENILLVTLGIAIVIENLALLFFKSRHAQHRHRLLAQHRRPSARR